jgi:hypothetical protein
MRTGVFKAVVVMLSMAMLTACQGADGATGPAGPQGPAGPAGPVGPQGPAGGVVRSTYFVTIAGDGYAEQALPAAFGTNPSQPPLLACHIAEVRSEGLWQPVSDGYTTANRTVCALVFDVPENRWYAVLINAPAGWTVAFSVISG